MYHHKSWGCTTTNLFGVLHKSHIFPHRAPSGAGVGISRLRPSMESYGPPAVLLQLYPVCFLFLHSIAFNYTTTISCSLLFCIQLWQLWPTRRFITTTSCALLILHIQLWQLWPTRRCATTISYTLLLLHMTRLQLLLPVQSQKPPNFKVL